MPLGGFNPFDLKVEHDLRTPLTIIRGYISLLEAHEVTLEQSLGPLRIAARELERSIEQLLANREALR